MTAGLHVQLPLTPLSLLAYLSSILQSTALLQATHAVQVCGCGRSDHVLLVRAKGLQRDIPCPRCSPWEA